MVLVLTLGYGPPGISSLRGVPSIHSYRLRNPSSALIEIIKYSTVFLKPVDYLWISELQLQPMQESLHSALIDMYAKCGKIGIAKEVFHSMKRDDVSVWNAMINGLATHGLALDAIAIFSKMQVENVLPDSITFVGILTACSHCGLVEEGRKFFDMMQSCFSIQPELEHYGTMVDLLGRTGLLEEAYAMIRAMPMEPDIVMWRALLSACRTHRKQELGEVAIANISCLQSGDFILLSNMYCSLRKWDSAERVREMMKKKGVRKKHGKSWIELGGIIHHFKAADQSHPEIKATYKMLEGLVQKTKVEGFTPLTELVLMDVSEEEKEENLKSHSEKLALAYGIMKSSPGTEIRVSKNLRICQDCHSWIKIVSRVLSRVVIVRDRIRFHQFEGGLCSCQDCW
ncbi:Pentatricopeptide repeat-containing protein [Quillaja saponaria]|uniref:Pentatricopeptide repeat-containing protein n=1 Tax=Quillaja saponaria TaxID=32244 RepID=A0AAD7PJG8_QUISA|nr:Pentatricopeptide repeat-containing protein [Quillaja saponaria]